MTDKPFKYAGTISHGTMRAEDLIPIFTSVLCDLDGQRQHALFAEYSGAVSHALTSGDWSDERIDDCLEALFEALNELAPEGYYFGAHPGDGADYGFWETDYDA